jgi:hypothetical protein
MGIARRGGAGEEEHSASEGRREGKFECAHGGTITDGSFPAQTWRSPGGVQPQFRVGRDSLLLLSGDRVATCPEILGILVAKSL